MTMRLFALPIAIGWAFTGCALDSSSTSALGTSDDSTIVECSNGPNECPKIEGNEVGTAGVTLDVDGDIVTFLSFQEKDDDGGYIGFTLDTSASFIVKAGNTCYAGEGTSWTHPAGTSGPDASAISNIQVCFVEPPPEPVCGDGMVDAGEDCDDGNNLDGDGCSANCTVEEGQPYCGDGMLDAGEECDDGNNTDGDGCSANCTIEPPAPFCGDGTLDDGEECDDGNAADGDGCSANCTIEPPPSSFCGDGTLDDGEECDDGNTANGDGCSSDCLIEVET